MIDDNSTKSKKELRLFIFPSAAIFGTSLFKDKTHCRKKGIPFIYSENLRCKAAMHRRIFIIIMRRRCTNALFWEAWYSCFRLILFHRSFTNSGKEVLKTARFITSIFEVILVWIILLLEVDNHIIDYTHQYTQRIHGKNGFVEVSKNLATYRSENNFVGSSK